MTNVAPDQADGPVDREERRDGERLGDLLRAQGVLNDRQVEEVLRFQSETGLAFGDASVKLGFLTTRDLKQHIARQRGYPYVESKGGSLAAPALVAARRPFSRQSDAIREIRSRLKEAWLGTGRKSVAVVSSCAGAGRSYLVANLAVSYAQMGLPTLVVDTDMRRPSQHQIFGVHNRTGLEAVLSMRDGLHLHRIREIPDLWLLPAGPTPLDAAQLLGSERFATLIESLEKRVEVILFDTPPLDRFRDGEVVAARVRAAVFVTRKDRSMVNDEVQHIRKMVDRGISVAGAVFNPGS
jgi:protein-tyrosine kinase